jgi:hypothetical protein
MISMTIEQGLSPEQAFALESVVISHASNPIRVFQLILGPGGQGQHLRVLFDHDLTNLLLRGLFR